jgi:hypothetical protein
MKTGMTKDEAEKVAADMRAAGWREVSLKVDDLGRWSAVGEDYDKKNGWLTKKPDTAAEH